MITVNDLYNNLQVMVTTLFPIAIPVLIALGLGLANVFMRQVRKAMGFTDGVVDTAAEERREALARAKAQEQVAQQRKAEQLKPPVDSRLVNAIAVVEYFRSLFIPGSCPKCGAPNPEHKLMCSYCGKHF